MNLVGIVSPFLLAAATALHADPAEALLAKAYAKLAASFSAGGAFGEGQDTLLLASPGQGLSAMDCKDPYAISMLADPIPQAGQLYQPGSGSCSSAYGTILAQAEGSAFVDQTHREQARLARRALFDKDRPGRPTKAYTAYLEFQSAHGSALDSLNLAITEQRTSGKPVPAGLEAAAQATLKAWEHRGGKRSIEEALGALENYYAENARSMLLQFKDDFELGRRSDEHSEAWFPVIALPPPETWFEDQGWKAFQLTSTERSLAKPTAAAGEPPGPQGIPGEFAATATLSMETKRVTLERPWLNMALFRSRRWRLHPGAGFSTVSSGQAGISDPGLLPRLVTGVLLSRRLVLKGQWRTEGTKPARDLGPFRLSGPGAEVRNGVLTLTSEAPQILGFFCKTIPLSPDPDEKAFRR